MTTRARLLATPVRTIVRHVGQAFGTVADIRSAKTNRVLATTQVLPYGFDAAARMLAADIIAAHGYTEASW